MRSKFILGITLFFSLSLFSWVLAQGQPPPPPGGGGPPTHTPLIVDESYTPVPNTYQGVGTVTSGSAEDIGTFNLPDRLRQPIHRAAYRDGPRPGRQVSGTVPSPISTDGALAVDIDNPCQHGYDASYLDKLTTTVIDPDGATITGWLFADNYFELFVNGQFVARDSVGFTPFNSAAVRFQASYPITYAVRLVDGETHLGLGMEYDYYNVGDGGFIAHFSDGAVTNAEWKCETVYIAPLDDPVCVTEDENGLPELVGLFEQTGVFRRQPGNLPRAALLAGR